MLDLTTVLNSMGAKQSDYPFRPVRCREVDLESKTPVNGFVYFTTDTHKIFLGHNGEYIAMGGTSGIYYGKRQLTDDEKYGDQILFNFDPSEIDGNHVPTVDDLILNIPDGGFYRVLNSSSSLIEAQRLVIAGGGSGGGGGTGAGGNEGSLAINFVTPQYSSTITGKDYYIEFDIVAKDSAGDLIREEGTATWKINGKEYTQKVRNGRNEFKVDQYLDHTIEQNKVVIIVKMNTGGMSETIISKTWYVTAINLALEWNWNYGVDEYRSGDKFTLRFTPYGNVDCIAHIIFDDDYTENVTYFKEKITASQTGSSFTTQPMNCLEYGVHTCAIYLTSDAAPEPTPTIKHEITFIEGGNSTILTVPYYETTATQYDTIKIPFLVYDPDLEKCNVSFYVNDEKIMSDSYNRDLHYWAYTPISYGTLRLTIRSDNGDTSKEIVLIVNELALNINEAAGAAFSLKANNFSGNQQLRDWNSNGVTLEFSDNFDWEKGGLQFDTLDDGSIEKYINVRQGTRLKIKYELFKNFTTGSSGGKNFKFAFKATNCYDYEAPVLTCYDERSKVGIRFNAQNASFETPNNQGFKTQYYENAYIEVETEIWPNVPDIKITSTKNILGDRFIMFWVDGVPAGVKAYEQNETLTQANPQYIEIGSDLCDVHVYVVKAHERSLSTDEHLNNFILDAPSANKMMDRYRRNDIVDTVGEISYEKLVAANPECRAYLYEVERMTTSKDDKIKNCKYYELYGEHNTLSNPYYKAEGVQTYVQGTSSAAYGVAAFNLRSKFGKLTDKDGNEVTGWQVADNALPIEIACTKVNVASCENINNVVNQEWYNRFQPYHDAHRRKTREDGKVYRDTMQFESGVIFIKDNNPKLDYYNNNGEPDRDGYLNANTFLDTLNYYDANKKEGKYYKQYAIGNMGNDKKNVNVFHDTTNPMAMCIEVTDNQNPEHWMTTAVNMSQFDLEKPFHEFRYPDGNDKASTEQKQAWLDFINWMVASNPSGYDNTKILKAKTETLTSSTYKKNVYFIKNDNDQYIKSLGDYDSSKTYYSIYSGVQSDSDELIEVLFDPYTYKGFNPPGFEDDDFSEITVKGQTENKYSTTKVQKQQIFDNEGNPVLNDQGEFTYEDIITIVPYTHDTHDYRMAKMLSECEDHLVMDSVVYHYLFIQRHTMVDNVAKNTFWSTEDGIHWDLTKDYDNDTADGNNNSGYLTFTYGIECLDTAADGADIFNASPSVWINFIHGLPVAQKHLHQKLEGEGAWDAQAYLAECKRHQEKIPERCWIYDYMRKYIRPRRLGLDTNTYLERLEGGKKTHQRAQYETYQEYYLNSKYVAGSVFSQSTAADLRLNKDPSGMWDPTNVLPMSFYIDCYSTIYLGGQMKTSPRLKRKDVWNAPVGEMIGSPNDATCYIFGPTMMQTISGLHKLYPFYATMTAANKLREIAFGSTEEGYYNSRLKAPDIGSNAMLQKVQLNNSGLLTQTADGKAAGGLGSLNLSGASQLKELYLSGSTTDGLTLADGGAITILELNPLTTLTLSNLTSITNLSVDDNISNYTHSEELGNNSIYKTIKNIYVANCPALDPYTYKFAKLPQIDQYQLNDFTWRITSSGNDYSLEEDFIMESDKVIGLKVLENLQEPGRPAPGFTRATAVTGKIIIDVPCQIDEYEIYEKYASIFPNAIIEYTNNVGVGLNPAVEIKFYSENSATSAVHYRVLASGNANGASIAHLISENGPLKTAMSVPNKEDTTSQSFVFKGYWIRKSTGAKYYDPASYDIAIYGEIDPEAQSLAEIVPLEGESWEFYPDYDITTRRYFVRFYDHNAEIILQNNNEIWPVAYNATYDGPMQEYYYRDSEDLNEYKRYTFLGWSRRYYKDALPDGIPAEDQIKLTELVVTNNINLYACYRIDDVRDVATDMQYFVVENYNGKKAISVREEYKNTLQGKITLPSKYNGEDITYIKDFSHMSQVTHIFFLADAKYNTVGEYAFYYTSGLTTIDLPASITRIEGYAFARCLDLTTITLSDNITYIGTFAFSSTNDQPVVDMKVQIDKLPASLEVLGAQAFLWGGPGITITTLPNNLQVLYSYTFNGCPNVKITELGSNDGSGSKLWRLDDYALSYAGTAHGGEIIVNVYKSVTTIGNQAFYNYLTDNAYYNFYRHVDVTGATDYFAEAAENKPNYNGNKSHPNITISGSPSTVSMGIYKAPDGQDEHYSYIES